MRPCDLAGERKVVVGDVGLWVPGAVLELHLKAATELLGIDLYPVDPEHGTEVTRFLHIDLTLSGHDLPPNGGHLEPCVRAVRLTAFSTSSLAVTGSGSLSPATRPRPSRRRGLRASVRRWRSAPSRRVPRRTPARRRVRRARRPTDEARAPRRRGGSGPLRRRRCRPPPAGRDDVRSRHAGWARSGSG